MGLILLLTLDWFLVLAYQPTSQTRVTVPYSYFLGQVQAHNVAIVTAQGSTIDGTVRHWITYNGTRTGLFKTTRPAFADDHLLSQLLAHGAVVNAKQPSSSSDALLTILGGVLPTVLLIGFWIWLFQRYSGQAGGAAGGMWGMGRSKAQRYAATTERTTFADVAGIDEAKDELEEVVDY
ncbi:MAG: cell division protein FtsH, partial [Solirubrobacterales bacterium]|nr:cell division protein FtsH [Solirubrobacterales bacterium]